MKTNKKQNELTKHIFDFLSKENVKNVEASFDGCGDSGQIESIMFDGVTSKVLLHAKLGDFNVRVSRGYDHTTREWKDNYTMTTLTIETAVEELVYFLLENKHIGWEINGGSFGSVKFDIENRKICMEFNERTETYNTEEYEV